MKLSRDQIRKILTARDQIQTMLKQCDEVYDSLVKEINFEGYQTSYDNFFGCSENGKPAGHLFDVVYNDTECIETEIKKLQQSLDLVAQVNFQN